MIHKQNASMAVLLPCLYIKAHNIKIYSFFYKDNQLAIYLLDKTLVNHLKNALAELKQLKVLHNTGLKHLMQLVVVYWKLIPL